MLIIFRDMPPQPLKSLVLALLKQLPENSSPVVIIVKPDLPSPTPANLDWLRQDSGHPIYDPSIVYILEFATTIAMRSDESVAAVGQDVAGALQSVVRDAANVHPLIVSRAAFYLLQLLNASQVRNQSCSAIPRYSSFLGPLVRPSPDDLALHLRLQSSHHANMRPADFERSRSMS